MPVYMAYVALSRVRSLSGLHLSAFDLCSIIASPSCIREVNRLREAFRKDLPLYSITPRPKARATKRKLTGEVDVPKVRKLVKLATKTLVNKGGKQVYLPQPPTLNGGGEIPHDPRDYHPRDEGVWPFSYYPVSEH